MAAYTDSEILNKAVAALENDSGLADLMFQCDDGTVPAHIAICSAWCTKVKDAATNSSARPLSIDVKPCTTEQVKICRHYMYTGKLELTASNAAALTSLSNQLGLTQLKHSVETAAVSRYVDAASACGYFAIGRRDGSLAVEGAARAYIAENTCSCIHGVTWWDMDPDAMVNLLTEDSLSVREEDLFRQVLAWADTKAAAQVQAQAKSAAEASAAAAAASTEGGLSAEGAGESAQPVVTQAAQPAKMLTHKEFRTALLERVLPHIRFPLMGAHVFARTVVPTGVLSPEDTNAVLMYYMAPDLAASLLKFNAAQRTGKGSTICWSASGARANGIKYLSKDRRIAQFSSPQEGSGLSGHPMLITDQTFAAGTSTVYITMWGCGGAAVGVTCSDSEVDDGDCAMMVAPAAVSTSPRFEGVLLGREGAVTPAVHNTRCDIAKAAPLGDSALPNGWSDGCTLILYIDWDIHHVTVSLLGKGRAGMAPKKIATLKSVPSKPLRVAFTASPRLYAPTDVEGVQQQQPVWSGSGPGDIEAVAIVGSKLPAYHTAASEDKTQESASA